VACKAGTDPAKGDVSYVAINRYWGDRYASRLNEEVFGRTYPLLETKRYFALDVYKYGLLR
jgi:hypothetical protein